MLKLKEPIVKNLKKSIFKMISLGNSCSAVIANGDLYTFGRGDDCQLGHGDEKNLRPVRLSGANIKRSLYQKSDQGHEKEGKGGIGQPRLFKNGGDNFIDTVRSHGKILRDGDAISGNWIKADEDRAIVDQL